eukprot:11780206-Karenia_brevis.AAC.1
MIVIAGLGEIREMTTPPLQPPQGPPRTNRPKRDWRFRLLAEAWQDGPQGLMSLGEFFKAAAYEVAPGEGGEETSDITPSPWAHTCGLCRTPPPPSP